jgi:Tol biopolymer transport system component
MSLSVIIRVAITFLILLFCAQAQSNPPARGRTLKDKIVFVHADPSIGVSSMRSITDVDQKSGSVAGGHAAPDLQSSASAAHIKDEIELMNPDGSSITPLHVFGSDPMISPDGSKIAYCSLRDNIYSQIYVMNSDGSAQKRITDIKTGDACGPAWSPDGTKIAYYAFANPQPSRNPGIWVINADGSNPNKLTDHGMDPSWSPNGQQIVFASHRDGVFQIYAMNADGSGVKRLTKHNAEDSNPVWAPDGSSIAYISATSDDRRGLFLMGPDGSDPHGVAYSKHQDFCFPSWSPDSKTIVFSELNRLGSQGIVAGEEKPRCEQWVGEYQIFAMDADGKIKQLTGTKTMGTRPSYGRIAAP